ncbi:MAG: hypothetical protein ACRYGI_14050 [Janthinobacterium lividum]
MLLKRVYLIAALMLVGFIVASISVWSLAFNMNSANVPAWTPHWITARLPILIGVLMIVGGFRLLSHTRVARPMDEIDDEDRTI